MWGRLYDCVNGPLERSILAPRRARLLAELTGVVLDVGAGTGANLRHFRSATRVIATEPSSGMSKRLAARLSSAPCAVELLDARAEILPMADASVDAVVFTCVLCSVDDVDRALAEARRALKPDGRLVVLEHVRGTDRLARWQDRITPLWSRVAGGEPSRRGTASNPPLDPPRGASGGLVAPDVSERPFTPPEGRRMAVCSRGLRRATRGSRCAATAGQGRPAEPAPWMPGAARPQELPDDCLFGLDRLELADLGAAVLPVGRDAHVRAELGLGLVDQEPLRGAVGDLDQ
jgi:SAM-dependent methyltransferase